MFQRRLSVPYDAAFDKLIMEKRLGAFAARKRGAAFVMKANPAKAYARAGVDVELGNTLKRGIQSIVRSTHGPEVLGKIGGFGGLFRANFRGMKDPVLVSSVDGVGS
jgi:hypothetical protein